MLINPSLKSRLCKSLGGLVELKTFATRK